MLTLSQINEVTQRVKLGILLNPRSRYNRRNDWFSSAQKWVGVKNIIGTRSIAEVPNALEHLLLKQGVTVLGICGGDGTIHHVLNALLQLKKERDTFSLPPILVLRGGTLNMLAHALHVSVHPEELLRAFQKEWEGTLLETLPVKKLRLLRIDRSYERSSPVVESRYGFIFGSDMTARCLDLYENQFGGGYRGLARFMQTVVTSFVLKTSFWKQNSDIFYSPPQIVEVEDSSFLFRAVAAGTIDIALADGHIVGMQVESQKQHSFQVKVLLDQSAGQIMRRLPHLFVGARAEGIVDYAGVQNLTLRGSAYSLDGEVVEFSTEPHYLTLSAPRTLSFVDILDA